MQFRELPLGALFVCVGAGISPILRKSGENAAEAVRGADPERKIISRDERQIPADTIIQRVDPVSIIGNLGP